MDLDKVGADYAKNAEDLSKASGDLLRERVRAGNTTKDSRGRMRDSMGQFYSSKSLDEAYNAVMELDATRIGITENIRRIMAHRQAILAKAQGINEIYGEKIVDIPGQHGKVVEELNKRWPEMFGDRMLKPSKISKEPVKKFGGPDPDNYINAYAEQGGKK